VIDETGRARLADFGLLTIISDPANLLSSSSCTQGGTTRWTSPEIISPEEFGSKKSCPTKASDCYALGMVIYETISGNLPFHEHREVTISMKVLKGDRPPRHPRFTNDLWEMLEWCWVPKPNDRPIIEDVLRCLETVSISSEAPLGVDEETEGYSDQDSGNSLLSVGNDRDSNADPVPDLSRLSVGPFIHDFDIDMDQVIVTTDVIPTLPPSLSPPMPPHVKAKPTPSHRVYSNTPPQFNFGGLSTDLAEGVTSGNSGSGTTTGTTNPTRKIVTRERIAHKVQKTKHISSADGRAPGTSNPLEDTTGSTRKKDATKETGAPLTAGVNDGTPNTPLWRRFMLHLPSVSFFQCPGLLFVRYLADLLVPAPLYPQLAGIDTKSDVRVGKPPVAPPLPVHPRCQPTSQPTIVINAGVPPCCKNSCGRSVPLIASGSYNDPLGDGKTLITFNLSGSPRCGISVARVLHGDLEGLGNRDDFVTLNRRSGSMRLRIEVGYPSPPDPTTS